ncbi:hypothetical protein BGZ80_002428 [Entomortierella chlamydospora]|uniref:Uncharacterized protein n=1 Tax=Entomortierella chlamydospora TaxID=101097 RepID=A0A9P6N6P5_9FUNG|nr:hypothetical protein BGZ80_002428 [Entomortierella chlamydospora]
MLNSPPSLPGQLMNFQRNSGHEAELGQVDDDPHGAAAMALTALSSGMGITSTAKHSLKATQSHLSIASGTMVGLGLEMTEGTATASRNLQESSPSATVARMSHSDNKAQTVQLNERRILTKASNEGGAVAMAVAGIMQSRQQTITEHSQPQPTCEPPLPESETIRLHPASHVPGERMQTLSHLLKDQLSLASMRSDQGKERDRTGSGRCNLLRHDDVASGTYEEDGRSPAHNSREDSARMYTEHRLYHQSISSPNLRLLTEETRQLDGMRYQRGMIEHTSLAAEWQQPIRHYENSYSPKGIRPLDQNSTSPLTEPEIAKPKRKYTKKTTVSPSLLENPNQEASHAVQEGELLQSDRGLILKTQIPKKGRPISKHSSISQSTPTLSSLGVLPASHPYFSSKTGISPSSSAPSFRPPDSNRSPLANYPRNPGYPPLTATTTDEFQPHAPIRRRPGRPPLASTIARHAHSQSHSSLQPGPFSASKSQSRSARYSSRDVHGRPPPPLSTPSPSMSVGISAIKSRHNRRSYPSSQGHEQLPVLESQHRIAAHQTEYEHPNEDWRFQNSHNGETLPSPGPASFAGGIPTQTNGRERGSYGAEKRQSTDDLYCLENERRGTSSVYDIKERQDEHYQDHAKDKRSKRRLTISDMDSVGSETNTLDGNETVQGWLDYGSEYRSRPRSLMLPRGISDSLLQLQSVTARTTDAACISELRHRTSGLDDDREMSEHRDSEMPITRNATRRSLHGHTRSLDLSSRSLFSLDYHPQPSTERAPESQSKSDDQAFGRSNSDSNIYSYSTSPPPLLTHVQYGKDYSTATNMQPYPSSSIDYQGYSLEPSETTRADELASKMSAGSSRGSKSRTGTISAQTKTSSKRLSRRGPGSYLKKHEILQMQLQQMQREQEEMEAQLVLQRQQELYQLQQRYSLESTPTANTSTAATSTVVSTKTAAKPPSAHIATTSFVAFIN